MCREPADRAVRARDLALDEERRALAHRASVFLDPSRTIGRVEQAQPLFARRRAPEAFEAHHL
jgi:hypothetical protein